MQENELSSAITQTVQLESTRREFSFEWSHLWVLSKVSYFKSNKWPLAMIQEGNTSLCCTKLSVDLGEDVSQNFQQ